MVPSPGVAVMVMVTASEGPGTVVGPWTDTAGGEVVSSKSSGAMGAMTQLAFSGMAKLNGPS